MNKNCKTPVIKSIHESKNDAIRAMTNHGKEYIRTFDGVKKTQEEKALYISSETKLNELADGYYLEQETDNITNVYVKNTIHKSKNGWLPYSAYEKTYHQKELVGYYSIAEFTEEQVN